MESLNSNHSNLQEVLNQVINDEHRIVLKTIREGALCCFSRSEENRLKTPHNKPHPGEREMQVQFGTTMVGEDLIGRIGNTLSPPFKAFIESQFMFFMATADADGNFDCNYRGGEPGFVRVADEKTILFADYNGNGSFMSMGNLTVNPRIGLLFIDFERQRRVRINGHAEVLTDSRIVSQFPGAERVIKVTVDQAFPNCPRYIHKMVRAGELPGDLQRVAKERTAPAQSAAGEMTLAVT